MKRYQRSVYRDLEMVLAGRWAGGREYKVWHPPTDVHETEAHYLVVVEVAGMKEGDFSISLSDRTLTIAGVRKDAATNKKACHQLEISFGEFRSEVVLPGPVDDSQVEAVYEDGFLRILLPMSPVRKVPVVEA
jgi:HSP20 family protein